ncbi:MAG TPA: hypothetical protein VGO93_06730 [Candidatus Xenobia bacterium]|jgi:hypothetical protein
MSKSAVYGIIITLLVISWFTAGLVHNFLESRDRPTVPTSPVSAVPPLHLFQPSQQQSSELLDQDPNHWGFHWVYTAPAETRDVLVEYSAVYKDPKTEADKTTYTVTPPGAESGDSAIITVYNGSPTKIDLLLYKNRVDTEPSSLAIGVVEFIVLLLIFLGVKGTMGRFVGSVATHYTQTRVEKRWEQLDVPPSDPACKSAWMDPEGYFRAKGFEHAFDYQVLTVKYTNYARLLARQGKIFASLVFARPEGNPTEWFELRTHYEDGTSVLTTTSPLPQDPRPADFPVHQLLKSMPGDVLAAHEQNIEAHKAAGHTIRYFGPERIFEVWQQQENLLEARATTPAAEAETEAIPEETSDPRQQFCVDTIQAIQQQYPELQASLKSGMTITIKKPDDATIDLDLTTVFMRHKNNPDGNVIQGFVAGLNQRLGLG